MREVDLAAFADAHRAGAMVIDVCEPFEYVTGHVPGAALVPLGHLPSRTADLPRTAPVYVICASGNRSLAAADFLAGPASTPGPWPAAPAPGYAPATPPCGAGVPRPDPYRPRSGSA